MNDWHARGDEGSDSIDASFDALSDPRRRSLCRYVMRTETDVVTSEELTDYVVDRAPETAAADVERQRVATELRHVHLPKLDEADVVEYDRRSETVHVDRETLTAHLERVRATVADLQDAQVGG